MTSGEFDLIAKFVERLPDPGEKVLIASGDDAAVAGLDGPVVVSVDAIVDGVHFERASFPPKAIGHKAIASAISDLAAMGAQPQHGYVVVGVPADESEEDLLGLADGIGAVASNEDMAVIGGDVVRSPVLMVSVTAIGSEAEDTPLVTRSGAEPGDAVVVTGQIGGAAAALQLLGDHELGGGDEALISRQLAPTPRVLAGQALARGGATAMIDLSDGLVADAGHLAAASKVRIKIEATRVPFQDAAMEVLSADPREAMIAAASGGEDYELLACLPPEKVEAVRAEIEDTCDLTEIGRVLEGTGAVLLDEAGEVLPATGFDHLAAG